MRTMRGKGREGVQEGRIKLGCVELYVVPLLNIRVPEVE